MEGKIGREGWKGRLEGKVGREDWKGRVGGSGRRGWPEVGFGRFLIGFGKFGLVLVGFGEEGMAGRLVLQGFGKCFKGSG